MPILRFGLFLALALLGGCASLYGPRTLLIPDAEIERHLAAQFPLERRWLEVFDISLSEPRIDSRRDNGRLRVEMQLRIGERLFDRGFRARLRLTAGVRYEPVDHSLRLRDVAIDAFEPGVEGRSLLQRAGGLPAQLLAQALDDAVIHQVGAAQLARIRRQGLELRGVDVVDDGLLLRLEPSR